MKPIIFGGHSLGAGRAADLSAIAALAGRPPIALVNFGEPHPGYAKLINIISSAGVRALSHSNGDSLGHDSVTDVPFVLPGFPFEHSCDPLISVSQAPARGDRSFFRYHHMPLYVAAVHKLLPTIIVPGVTVEAVAEIVDATYHPDSISWDHFDDGTQDDGVTWGIKEFDTATVLALRGSVSLLDWLRDLLAIPAPWGDAQLGPVHPGFLLGMRQVWEEFSAMLPWPPK